MKPDNLYALFAARLQRLDIGLETDGAIRALAAYIIRASNTEALGILAEGLAHEALLPTDEEGYFSILNEWQGVSGILAKAKAEGKIDPVLKIGVSAFQDRMIYAELLEDEKAGYFEPRESRYGEPQEVGTLAEINAKFDEVK
ncbi:MAG: hypothetical protein WC455_25990 [Dehalococcoidia bacterium]|jgi:hypothetical protein